MPATNARQSAGFLRVVAVLQMATGAITFVPTVWIAAWYKWLGLGVMPDDPVLRYVIRGGAYVQGAIGILIWIIATDVVRYRPLVLAVSTIYLISGPAFYLIDSIAGMPRFWCIIDGVSCFAVGAVAMVLYGRAPKS